MGFDLERAIAAWRRPFEYHRAFSEEDIEELEGNLRDRVEALVQSGISEEAAFNQALLRMGSHAAAQEEYRKVHRAKQRRRGALLDELTWWISMWHNHLRLAWRNALRQKGYTLINVAGLSIGLACSFFILLWVTHELSYDRFHEDGEQIYRVWRNVSIDGQIYTWYSMPKPAAETMEIEYPEVVQAVPTRLPTEFVISTEGRSYRETGMYAGSDFFEVFSFPFLQGDPETALQGTNSVVITDRTARKLFGEDWGPRGDVLGRSLTIDHRRDFTVTGVVQNPPENSTIQFDALLPIQEFFERNRWVEDWSNNSFPIYVKLRKGTSLEAFNAKVADLINRHYETAAAQVFLQPFEDVHLRSRYRDGRLVGGRIQYVRIFSAAAIFLLLIACINFMNLATARSSQRAREIGVRKAIGAHRYSLVSQFMTESMAMAFVAFLIALGLVVALLPVFNDVTDKHLTVADLDGSFLLGILGISLIVGVISGSYPAIYLSSFKPVAVLRGALRQPSGTVTLRKGLIVFQFAISMLLIVSTVAVSMQLDHIRTTNLGLERENLLFVNQEGALTDQLEAVRHELLEQPGIASVTASGQNPLAVDDSWNDVTWEGKDPDNMQLFHVIAADFDFVETMRMDLVAGRDFSRAFGADSGNYLLNEKAAEVVGGDVIGKTLAFRGRQGQIVGVVRDFSMNSLYSPIEPTIIRFDPEETRYLFVRTEPGGAREALAALEAVYERFNPGYPFEHTFLDQQFEETYRSEAVMGTLANIFTVIGLFISCLGLFGLTSFTVEQRTKEVGVRKVLGASVLRLVVLLTSDLTKLVLMAVLLAAPAAYVLVRDWLGKFEDHIALGVEVFLLAGVLAMLVSWLTVGYQSIKAALADPVKSLRYE